MQATEPEEFLLIEIESDLQQPAQNIFITSPVGHLVLTEKVCLLR